MLIFRIRSVTNFNCCSISCSALSSNLVAMIVDLVCGDWGLGGFGDVLILCVQTRKGRACAAYAAKIYQDPCVMLMPMPTS